MLNLPNITLTIVTSVKIEQNIDAMIKSTNGIQYGDIKFISHEHPRTLPHFAEFVQCEPLDYVGFSRFTFHELWKYIDTDFSLLVHHDGWVTSPENWDNRFLDFDYIGAPWAYSNDSYTTDYGEHVRVGNAGVCIRSKKLLEMPTKLGLELEGRQGFYNDDGNFCVYHRKTFLENGIKYAPIELAAKFSREVWIHGISRTDTFAFHGNNRIG
jgi:hypothetical protein